MRLSENVRRKKSQADTCVLDMSKQFVIDPLISKRSQLLLATQVVRMILRVDDVIGKFPSSYVSRYGGM